jgi:steroid delta-isomerase-like uncharacterized protein
MSLEKNKAIIRSIYEAANKHDLALMVELTALDYVDHDIPLHGVESFKLFETAFLKGFPDVHVTIEDMTAEGDRVWVHMKYEGTHTGEYRGIAPTGKKFTMTAFSIFRIVKGKVAERKSVYDMLDFCKQLGVIEYTEKAKKLFPEDVK